MGTYKLEMEGVCVKDWEDDFLCQLNPTSIPEGFTGGIARLIREAGGVTVDDTVTGAFSEPDGDDPYQAKFREKFRQASGLEVPPVMRVRVHVEVDTLSPEESKALWDSYRTRVRALREELDEEIVRKQNP